MSTGAESPRASSASSREASEISLIRRSSRRTSCCITAISRSREGPGFDARQSLQGAAQGRQRIFELVGDIGRETLDRVHALVKRLRHVAQSAGEMADLVGSIGEIRESVDAI